MTGETLIIWGIGTSRTLRVHWLARELGLDYETRPVQARTGETQTPGYLAMSPKGKVPVLQHGATVVTESAAILNYLSESYGAGTGVYVPDDAASRAALHDWCYSVMTELDAHPLYIMRRHDALSDIYGEAPEAVASAAEYFDRMVTALALRYPKGEPFLFGERLSIADILLCTTLGWADNYGLALPAVFADYLQRVRARPAFDEATAWNDPGASHWHAGGERG
ncbi:MAG: glutathione S-transferase family protein [Pseudomonadota bacterium]